MFIKNGIESQLAGNSHMTLLSVPVKENERRTEPFYVCKRKNSVAVIVNDGEHFIEKKYLLVWQHRFACDRFGWEIPQGSIEKDEEGEQSAARELYEETGFKSNKVYYLGDIYEAGDWCTAKTMIFTTIVSNVRSSNYELKCGWFTAKEIKKLFEDGLIFDSVTLAALLLNFFKGDFKWKFQ